MSARNNRSEISGPVQSSVVGDNATVTMNFNGETYTVEILKLLEPITEARIRAEDWKCLHETFQKISVHLLLARKRPEAIYSAEFPYSWNMDCSDPIHLFVKFFPLPEGKVREEFFKASNDRRWLETLKGHVEELDEIIGQCLEARDRRAHLEKFLSALQRLEFTSGSLLSFLDGRLRAVIRELDQAIVTVTQGLTEPPGSTQPKVTA